MKEGRQKSSNVNCSQPRKRLLTDYNSASQEEAPLRNALAFGFLGANWVSGCKIIAIKKIMSYRCNTIYIYIYIFF